MQAKRVLTTWDNNRVMTLYIKLLNSQIVQRPKTIQIVIVIPVYLAKRLHWPSTTKQLMTVVWSSLPSPTWYVYPTPFLIKRAAFCQLGKMQWLTSTILLFSTWWTLTILLLLSGRRRPLPFYNGRSSSTSILQPFSPRPFLLIVIIKIYILFL